MEEALSLSFSIAAAADVAALFIIERIDLLDVDGATYETG